MPPAARPDRRREDLLADLVGLFLREGFATFSTADLAERLHCSKTTLYLVAPSKEQLVVTTVRSFFRRAAERIEAQVSAVDDPVERLRRYLAGVAAELEPASAAFRADLAAFGPAAQVYRENTLYAAARVQALVAAGVEAGALRPAHTRFVGAAVTEVMVAIQRGDLAAASGLTDAEAYRELVDLVLLGLSAGPAAPSAPRAAAATSGQGQER